MTITFDYILLLHVYDLYESHCNLSFSSVYPSVNVFFLRLSVLYPIPKLHFFFKCNHFPRFPAPKSILDYEEKG